MPEAVVLLPQCKLYLKSPESSGPLGGGNDAGRERGGRPMVGHGTPSSPVTSDLFKRAALSSSGQR